ncbi:MAG: hypothetical protein R2706_01825 [Acidimicrobiales bacterium]
MVEGEEASIFVTVKKYDLRGGSRQPGHGHVDRYRRPINDVAHLLQPGLAGRQLQPGAQAMVFGKLSSRSTKAALRW